MMEDKPIEFFKVILAGRKIEIECHYRVVFYQCRDYLANFDQPDFVVRASLKEIFAERKEIPEMQNHDPGVAVSYADEFAESGVIYRRIAEKMLDYDTLLMHGSVVATDHYAYMFTAASGVGKSTRTKIWMDVYPGSFVVNGDKPLIRMEDNKAIAYGTPWCGGEGWNTNIGVPLRAIFLLERANEGERSTIEEITLGKAFPELFRQTNSPTNAEALHKTVDLLKALAGKVKLYKFRSTPTPEAVRLAYETARPR